MLHSGSSIWPFNLIFFLFFQLVGLYLIFASSEHKEAAMAVILVTIVADNFPSSIKSRVQTLW